MVQLNSTGHVIIIVVCNKTGSGTVLQMTQDFNYKLIKHALRHVIYFIRFMTYFMHLALDRSKAEQL